MTKLTRSKTKPKDRIKSLKKRLANAEHNLKKKESKVLETDKIQEHLDETGSKVAFMPNDGPQTDFLASSEREVLYGGSAGGGKSIKMSKYYFVQLGSQKVVGNP